jgi:hypothetical protein
MKAVSDLVKHLNADGVSPRAHVEEVDGLLVSRQLLESLNLHLVGEFSLDRHFVFAGVLHEEDVQDVEDKQDLSLPHFNLISVQEDGHDD